MTEASSTKTLKTVAIGTTVGAAVGGVVVAVGFLAIGLSPIGPIAGGWFATNMGAGLASTSGMAMLQSAAMTTGAYYTGAGVGGVIGGASGILLLAMPLSHRLKNKSHLLAKRGEMKAMTRSRMQSIRIEMPQLVHLLNKCLGCLGISEISAIEHEMTIYCSYYFVQSYVVEY